SSMPAYSCIVSRAPSFGSASIAGRGAQSPPVGTGPVPMANSMNGSASLGTGSPLKVQAAGVSMETPASSVCVTHPGGGGDGDELGVLGLGVVEIDGATV